MSWDCKKEKEFILECLGTPGFRDVFMWEVSKGRPLQWDGYRIVKFFNIDKYISNEKFGDGSFMYDFLDRKLYDLARTMRFPINPIHEAALYFWLWRRYVKSSGMQCFPESPADDSLRPNYDDYDNGTSCVGQWTIFYLMYLDSLTWRFPDAFKLDPFEKNKEPTPREKYIFGEVCRQLCGVRTSSARVFHDRTGSEAEYRNICSHCAKKHWAARFNNAEKHPALVLALSFYANGFASFKTESNHKPDADSLNANYLYDLVNRSTDYKVFIPEEDWEARALFFILAQWLFLSDRRITEPTLEEHIFAILYLRFYRQGVDEYFKRESMSAIWDGIPYEKKEDVAVHYRRLLAGTRNKAAEAWPEAKISDYPEIAEDGIAIGMVFQEFVRGEQYEKLDILFSKHSQIIRPYRRRESLWAASHSKKMYSYLNERHFDFLLLFNKKSAECDCYSMVTEGWSNMPVEDLQWSCDAVKKELHPKAYQSLIGYASLVMFADVIPSGGKPVQFARLKAYVEVLKLDPNAGDTGEYTYNASHPIIYRLMESYRSGRENAIAYLLMHGANPNCGGHRCTCLGLAVAGNRLRLIKMLIDSGADVNLPSTTGRTPVGIAIDHKRVKVLEILIDAGARPVPCERIPFPMVKQSKKIRQFLEQCIAKSSEKDPSTAEDESLFDEDGLPKKSQPELTPGTQGESCDTISALKPPPIKTKLADKKATIAVMSSKQKVDATLKSDLGSNEERTMEENKKRENENWVDKEWGGIVSCEALTVSSGWPWNKGTCVPNLNPTSASCDFKVRYQNGKVAILSARGSEILAGCGFGGVIEENGEKVKPEGEEDLIAGTGPRFFNIRLVGTVARVLEHGDIIPPGTVGLDTEEEAIKALKRLGIPQYPAKIPAEEVNGQYQKYYDYWVKNGICIVDEKIWSGACVSKLLYDEFKQRASEENNNG